jgi:hypothetical protein
MMNPVKAWLFNKKVQIYNKLQCCQPWVDFPTGTGGEGFDGKVLRVAT